MVHAHHKLDPTKHPEIHKIGANLESLTEKMDEIVEFEANTQETLRNTESNVSIRNLTRNLTEKWCQSYKFIEDVLESMLELFGVNLEEFDHDGMGVLFRQEILEKFDEADNPLNELLGFRELVAESVVEPVAEVAWSETWRERLAYETALANRSLTLNSIQTLGMFRKWWYTDRNLNIPVPKFLEKEIGPPQNYKAWFGPVINDLILAFGVCHKAELEKIKAISAANRAALDKKPNAPSAPVREPAAPESLRLRRTVIDLQSQLTETKMERDIARAESELFRWQRDEAREQLWDLNNVERAMIARADTAEEIWGHIQRAFDGNDYMYEYIRDLARQGY